MKYMNKTAKAAVFMGANKAFEIRDFLITPPPVGMAKAELIASGICGTDVHIHRGKLGSTPNRIIGHEFVGRIIELPEGAENGDLKVGDAVIADIAVPCGVCPLCKNGDDANCVSMKVTNSATVDQPPYLHGGFTEINYTPLKNLIKIPDELDPVMVCTFACPGPTAIHAFSLAKQAGVTFKKDDVAVVQGLGPVGCFAVMYLRAIGVGTIYAITAGNNQQREELAVKLGATEVLNLTRQSEEEINDYIKSKTDGLGANIAFEASGAPAAVPQAFQFLRNRATYLVPGQYSRSGEIAIQPQLITFKALHIIGSSQYSICDVEAYLQFLCEHPELHDTIRALGKKYKVEDVNAAFDDAKTGNNIKTMLVKQ